MTGLMLWLMLNATVVIPAGEAFVISGISKRSAAAWNTDEGFIVLMWKKEISFGAHSFNAEQIFATWPEADVFGGR